MQPEQALAALQVLVEHYWLPRRRAQLARLQRIADDVETQRWQPLAPSDAAQPSWPRALCAGLRRACGWSAPEEQRYRRCKAALRTRELRTGGRRCRGCDEFYSSHWFRSCSVCGRSKYCNARPAPRQSRCVDADLKRCELCESLHCARCAEWQACCACGFGTCQRCPLARCGCDRLFCAACVEECAACAAPLCALCAELGCCYCAEAEAAEKNPQ